MSVPGSVAEVLRDHVVFELDGIDRLYLNLYIPILQRPEGVANFWIHHRGHRFASSGLMDPMTRAFVTSIEKFAADHDIPLIQFKKGQRKDDLAKEYLAKFSGEQGVLFIGKAQEKTAVVRTQRRKNLVTGSSYPWLFMSSAMVNHYYFYCVDRDFGPFFLKFASYFPYNGKLCINGHEYLKRQLFREDIVYEALDNGLAACADIPRAQEICDNLDSSKIDALARKWFSLLPHPFPAEDRQAGYLYDISILQAEFSKTQVLDRPLSGRIFFEQAIRDNIDLGRPDHVQLIFERKISSRTPGRFRTRILTEGVIPTIYVDYKKTRIKQYFKEGRAIRTETTINDTRDFAIGKRLKNLPDLRKIGFQANQRLLDVQRISHDCCIGEDEFQQIHQPVSCGQQRAAALRSSDPRVLAVLATIVSFRLLPNGFANRDLRQYLEEALGRNFKPGQMTYELRRLRLHGFIERVPKSHRYQVTVKGARAALFLIRVHARLLRPGFATINPEIKPPAATPIRRAFEILDHEIDRAWASQQVAA